MSKNGNWKSKLLSSGIPLEFEAAKMLASKGFAVDADYTFNRIYDGVYKDSSVDILATGYLPLSDPNDIKANLCLLIECKYRSPKTQWLFLPEINNEDFSPFYSNTIRVHDVFSSYTMEDKNIREFSLEIQGCYKGVEVDLDKGAVYESEIKRGLNQLRYALPRFYSDSISSNALQHPDDSVPLLFCSILLTNAKLNILKKDATMENVRNSSDLADISEPADIIEVYSGYGPDFKSHCINACRELQDIEIYDRNGIFKRRTEMKIDKYDFVTPLFLTRELTVGSTSFLNKDFTQFVICRFEFFESFLSSVNNVVEKDLATLHQVIMKE